MAITRYPAATSGMPMNDANNLPAVGPSPGDPPAQIAADGSIPEDARHWRREHFIPLRKSELVELLADRIEDAELKSRFLDLCRILAATLHHEFHDQLERLKDLYSGFNPDTDVKSRFSDAEDADASRRDELFDRFATLLDRANYQRMTRGDIAKASAAASHWGVRLQLDFEVFERLEVFARGDIVGLRTRRRLRNYYREEEIEVPIYQKLVVIFQLTDHPSIEKEQHVNVETIYIKMFKNIPKQDVDMLLPGTRFRMTLLDRGRIILPTLSGILIALIKIIKIGVVLAFSSVAAVLAFLGFVGGTVGYGVKSFLGYLRTKDKYQLNLHRSLYYQNLDNNAGVLFRVLDEAEEQEFREAVLAYFLLWQEAGPQGWTIEQLDKRAERWLCEVLDVHVDFEVDDGLRKLQRWQLARKSGDRWQALPVAECFAALDAVWDGQFGGD